MKESGSFHRKLLQLVQADGSLSLADLRGWLGELAERDSAKTTLQRRASAVRGFFAGKQLARTGYRAERFTRADDTVAYRAAPILIEKLIAKGDDA